MCWTSSTTTGSFWTSCWSCLPEPATGTAGELLGWREAFYLTLVGSGHVVPRLPIEALERIWDMLLEPISTRR